jgi:hypothetical protein
MSESITSDCKEFGKGFSPDAVECKECEVNFPEEYKVCVETCRGPQKEADSVAEDISDKPLKADKKDKAERNELNHAIGTIGEFIDSNINEKTDAAIVEEWNALGKGKKLSVSRVRSHLHHLVSSHGAEVVEDKISPKESKFSVKFGASPVKEESPVEAEKPSENG